MWKKWFPWRFILKKVAQKQGFLDPVDLIAKIQRFAQPSEVAAPVELIRLATVMQARGLLNVQAIQHNLDWIWPYWVARQFNPRDTSFIPRSFSLTHINLTHRNWTAVGLPDYPQYPIVDSRGLVTPFYDSWSMDFWIIPEDGEPVFPSYSSYVSQKFSMSGCPSVITKVEHQGIKLVSEVSVELEGEEVACVIKAEAYSQKKSWLVMSLRPFNPEGVSEIEHISISENKKVWSLNKRQKIYLGESPDGVLLSQYNEGDVYQKIKMCASHFSHLKGVEEINCKAGMASGAALFDLKSGKRMVYAKIPMLNKPFKPSSENSQPGSLDAKQVWQKAWAGHAQLSIQDKECEYIFNAAVTSLILHTSQTDIYPGPYTYKHFWFRDACLILHALLVVNLAKRAEIVLDHFPARQKRNGFFCSQDGEWDSNGQVLWIFRLFCELTQTKPKDSWKDSIIKGARWIQTKRVSEDSLELHAGLFPSGFSAEHLGPNDFYYWDDFWGVEGLYSAASLMKMAGDERAADEFKKQGDKFLKCTEVSLKKVSQTLGTKAMPSSPYRRLDTASIGSLVVGYPLDFWAPDDERVMQTTNYLVKNHYVNGGFFHDMSHSGINPYLTLAIAQILLRNNDRRYSEMILSIQKLASSTGQWPEAIHPQTLGGCMGDGQHIWAAAEWIMMIRNCFVRQEKEKLIFCSGILESWLAQDGRISFGETLTPYGAVTIEVEKQGKSLRIKWRGNWKEKMPQIEVWYPGFKKIVCQVDQTELILNEKDRHV